MSRPKTNNVWPMMVVKNLRKTVDWYTKKLGFKPEFVEYREYSYASLWRGDIGLMFHGESHIDDKKWAAKIKKSRPRGLGTVLYMNVKDVNKYHAELKKKKIKMFWPLKDQPWGARTFTVADPDGYLLTFMTEDPKAAAAHHDHDEECC